MLAICIENVSLSLGSYLEPIPVLNNLNLTIPKGCIYGLIGPSGCGKTTLQKVIIGIHKTDTGVVSVFGSTPGTLTSMVPGPAVGYMPQEIALDDELTVREQLTFLGRINNLTMEMVNERINEICSTLEIHDLDKRSGQFSGGQQRSISLACTLIHRPSIYLLDEPTVGCDIVLVHKIWDYLKLLRDTTDATIIISTHYIEEVNSADLFGFMLDGKIIIQDTPSNFIVQSGTRTLEEAILKEYKKIQRTEVDFKLCNNFQEARKVFENDLNNTEMSSNGCKEFGFSIDLGSNEVDDKSLSFISVILLLAWRYSVRWKVLVFLPFIIFSVVICANCILLFIFYGQPVHGLVVGLVNHDNHSRYMHNVTNYLQSRDISYLQMSDEVVARKAIENGTITGFMVIPNDWDDNLRRRVLDKFSSNVDESLVTLSQVQLSHETIHAGKVLTIQSRLYQSIKSLTDNITKEFGLNPKYNEFFDEKPIFESLDDPEMVGPKYIFMNRLYLFYIETYTLFILTAWYRKESIETVNERLTSLGLKSYQFLMASMMVATVVQTVTMVTMFIAFIIVVDLPTPSSWFATVMVTMFLVICGICKAHIIGTNIESPIGCMVLILTYNLFLWLLGCVAWPYEVLPYFMQTLTIFFPHHEPSNSLIRMTIYKDSVWSPQVYHGLGVTTISTMVHLLITFTLVRTKYS